MYLFTDMIHHVQWVGYQGQTETDRQTHRHTDRQKERQTDRQTDRVGA